MTKMARIRAPQNGRKVSKKLVVMQEYLWKMKASNFVSKIPPKEV
jgi:hypothetical protein